MQTLTPIPVPHIPDRPGHWFSVVWRRHCVSTPADGWQPLTFSGDNIEETVAAAEREIQCEARNSDLTPAKLKQFSPMPNVEIKHVRWVNGKCETRELLITGKTKSRLRQAWLENIPEDHPDRAATVPPLAVSLAASA